MILKMQAEITLLADHSSEYADAAETNWHRTVNNDTTPMIWYSRKMRNVYHNMDLVPSMR